MSTVLRVYNVTRGEWDDLTEPDVWAMLRHATEVNQALWARIRELEQKHEEPRFAFPGGRYSVLVLPEPQP